MPRLLAALLIGCGIALAVAVLTAPEDDSSADDATYTISRAPAELATPISSHSRSEQDAELGRGDAPAMPDRAPPPDDPLSERWDDLTQDERIRIQRERFAEAVAAVRAGDEVEHSLAQARDSLTVLRTELYASPAGRRQHRALEEELDALAEKKESTGPRGAP